MSDLLPISTTETLATILAVERAPEIVLEEAHKAAAALKRVIDAKPEQVKFGPKGKEKQYLVYEDWQTIGQFYGIKPRNVSSKPLTLEGGASGWEATAEAIHVATGRVVSSADGMCLDDEEKWSARPKYAYVYHKRSGGTSLEDPGKDELVWEKSADGKNRPKKERMQIGVEQVPQFQLRSMAQTRAGAKALRNALAWVVVLAGYAPTPAEEMDTEPPRPSAEDAVISPPLPSEIVAKLAQNQQDNQIPPSPRETVEQEAMRLFPTPEEEEQRAILLGKIAGHQDSMGRGRFKQADRLSVWTRYLSAPHDPNTAPLAELKGVLRQYSPDDQDAQP